jgi:hypothetical protein
MVAAVAIALAGCDSNSLPTCEDRWKGASIRFCADLDPLWASEVGLSALPDYNSDRTLKGTLEGTADSYGTEACSRSTVAAGSKATPVVLRLKDAKGRSGTVAFSASGPIDSLAAGAEVEVFLGRPVTETGQWSRLLIRAAGALYYLQDEGRTGDPAAPDVTISMSASSCGGQDDCGSWEEHNATFALGTERVELGSEQVATISGYRVNFRSWVTDVGSSSCSDWTKASRSYSVFKVKP